MASPFFGGGSFERHCAHKLGIRVFGCDAFEPLVNFWKALKRDPHALARKCQELVPRTRGHYDDLLSSMTSSKASSVERAACFFNAIRTILSRAL
jgi:site-specific DNA-adenine methylase